MNSPDFWGVTPEPEDLRASGTPEMPQKKYNIIYADPPWSYQDKGCNGNAEDHYRTMTLADICNLPINGGGGIAADDCVLFMWATYPMMAEALKVIEAWGFTYKTIGFQWVKLNRSGNGHFFRPGALDAGQYRTLPDRHQGKAQADQRGRVPAGILPDPQP